MTAAEQAMFLDMRDRVFRRTDRLFAWLLMAQWIVAIGLALVISPYTWSGTSRAIHLHVKLAVVGGGLINVLPILLIRLRPGWWGTRQVVAVTQMLWSALLIMVTNGRIETHFHVFGSLAFLAFYRDWKLLLTATVVVAADHLARGLWWPDSVYGIANPEWWRFLEHATWVAFEDIVLVLGCVRQVAEMRSAARREARLEETNANVERQVRDRTRQLVERTSELDHRNGAMTFVLDNVDQGLFTIDLDGRIAAERSAAVERLLGPVPEAATIVAYVAQFAPDHSAWFDMSWSSLRDTSLPVELVLEQLPRDFEVNGKHLELAYKCIDSDGRTHVMVVVTDATARIARDEVERDHREVGNLATRLIADRHGFNEFYAEMRALLETAVEHGHTPAEIRIPIHTVKGNAAMFGLASIAELCHRVEDAIDQDRAAVPVALQALVARWQRIDAQLRPLTSAGVDRLEIEQADLDELVVQLRALPDGDAVVRLVDSWHHEPMRAKLERLAQQARGLSSRLGKDPLVVSVECDRSRLPPKTAVRFWSTLVHVVRNAVDHGIETPDERVAAGKSDAAAIALRAERRGAGYVVEIEDRGRGIDWTRLADLAHAAGIRATTRDELIDVLFVNGITTRAVASETSGRGVGLAAVRDACVELGGTVAVDSERGKGTTFRFMLPEIAAGSQHRQHHTKEAS
jgi:two-component system chemotaxis sensor kinase CheA